MIDLAKFIANNGSVPGCPAMVPQCNARTCMSQGECTSIYGGFHCECNDTFSGQRWDGVVVLFFEAYMEGTPLLVARWKSCYNQRFLHKRTPSNTDLKKEGAKALVEQAW